MILFIPHFLVAYKYNQILTSFMCISVEILANSVIKFRKGLEDYIFVNEVSNSYILYFLVLCTHIYLYVKKREYLG